MLPTTFEFRWDAGHMIFFGAFYSVVTVVLTSLIYTVVRSMIDVYRSYDKTDVDGEQTVGPELSGDHSEQGTDVPAKT